MTDKITEAIAAVIRDHRNAGRSSEEIANAVLALVMPRPLVWEHYDKNDTYPEAWTADTPREFITIVKDGAAKNRIIWEWAVECDTLYSTLELAQAAAQAHATAAWLASTPLGDMIGGE